MEQIQIPIETRPITEEEEVALGFSPRRGMLDLDIYTMDDLAERLDLTKATIKAHVKRGALKAVKFGGPTGFRFLRHDVYAWLISMQTDLIGGSSRGQNFSNSDE